MKFAIPLFLFFFCFSCGARCQTATFEFDDQVCSYQGIYDTALYTKSQLKDTYRLVADNYYVADEGNVAEVTRRYQAVIESLDSLEIVENPYFQIVRDSVRTYLKQTLSLKRAQKLAREEPSLLLSSVAADSRAYRYGQALVAGGELLLTAYKELVEEQMKNNAMPDYLFDEYQAVMDRDNREEIAFEKLLVYGWWNSANDQSDHLRDRRLLFESFLELFLEVKTVHCDEV
ncbi:MAG: hypothetical protein ACTJHT_12245 [Sphingobacterium sp.]|uniref:hypothetical protein n=1 Tax=Sphingobacterium sp. JB170 TaxID=1434842 RepID=UPI00097F4263|nr:hypothetical protein [Sphingobacterium sp. JB170]SJN45370.1 hypothetical protein FM107_13600 [Sphingobacterium sp. JB170]